MSDAIAAKMRGPLRTGGVLSSKLTPREWMESRRLPRRCWGVLSAWVSGRAASGRVFWRKGIAVGGTTDERVVIVVVVTDIVECVRFRDGGSAAGGEEEVGRPRWVGGE